MRQGRLFIISGPSGVGKGTICKHILEDRKNMKLSISATTRMPRKSEVDKRDYFFKTKEEFEKMIEENQFLEYANVFGNYYGTPQETVEEELKRGNDVLLEIDVQGALQVKKRMVEAVLIFILPPTLEELKNRIFGRGTDSKDVIENRLAKALKEISFINQYDYSVINANLEKAIGEVNSIIISEHLKVNDDILTKVKEYEEEM